MNWSLFITIVSFIATVTATILGIVLAKRMKYSSQLSYTVLNKSKVLERVPGSFDDLSLKYNNYSINQNLHYIQAMVFNTRCSDVMNVMPDNPISIELPSTSKWVDVRIKKESPSVGSSIRVSADSASVAQLSFNLLKENDSIEFEGLVESESPLPLSEEDVLSVSHRLINVDKFRYVPTIREEHVVSSGVVELVAIILTFLLACISGFFLIPKESSVKFKDSLSGEVYVVTINKNDQFVLKCTSLRMPDHKEIIDYESFVSRFTPVQHYDKRDEVAMTTFYGLILLFVLVLVLCVLYNHSKKSRNYQLIKRIESMSHPVRNKHGNN